MSLIPDSFVVPERHETDGFLFRKLCFSDTEDDYAAVMSSIDVINQTRGKDWPDSSLTFEEDQIDLAWHQREFEFRSSFAYVVYSPDESTYIGCFYLYPPGQRNERSANADVDVSFWVTQAAYEQGLYEKLYKELDTWLSAEWPFETLGYSNDVIPEDIN